MKNLYSLKMAIRSILKSYKHIVLIALMLPLSATLKGQRKTKPWLMKHSFIEGSRRLSLGANLTSNSFYSFSFDNDSYDINAFIGFSPTLSYSKVLKKRRVREYELQASLVEHSLYRHNSYSIGFNYAFNVFNYRSMLFINTYGGIFTGYDYFKEFDTNKAYHFFSYGAKLHLETEVYLTNFFIVAARLSPTFKVYNRDFFRYYYNYGLAVKYSF